MDHRKMFGLALCAMAVYFAGGDAPCSTHYVSPDGGNVPPYTRPETAARSISDAVEAAEWGDTILVAPGGYPDEDVEMRPGVTLEGNPPGARIHGLGSLWTAQWCRLKNLTFQSVDSIRLGEANVVVTDSSFSDIGVVRVNQSVAFVECRFSNARLDLRGIWEEVPPRPVFAGCKMAYVDLEVRNGVFYRCSFISTHSSPDNGLFIECVAGKESGFSGRSDEDRAVFKHCTLGYLCFEGFLLVEDCIIDRIWDGFPERALHNCILRGGEHELPDEVLAASNSRRDTPVFAGWVAYEDTGVYVAPGGDPGGDGTEGDPLPLVSSGLYQTYDYHLVAGSPGIGEASDGRNIGAYPDAEPVPRGTEKVVVNIAPGRYADYLEGFYGRGSIHLRKHGEGEVRIELPGSLFTDETDVLEGITFAGGRVGGHARITDCVFEGSAYSGLSCGGPQEAPSLISRCRFENNAGAGALVYRDHVTIFDNCVFRGNGTGLHGYGLAIATNCTISGNDAAVSENVDMTNSIVWGNHVLCDATPSSLVATYSLIQGGYSGEGNIQSDPLFIDIKGRDFRLRPDSPCVDAGFNDPQLPETDTAGMHRIVFGGKSLTVDMGAYEYYINDLHPGPGADEATLTWSSWHRRTYSIFYSDDLLTWHLADGGVASGGYETTSWIDDCSAIARPPPLLSDSGESVGAQSVPLSTLAGAQYCGRHQRKEKSHIARHRLLGARRNDPFYFRGSRPWQLLRCGTSERSLPGFESPRR